MGLPKRAAPGVVVFLPPKSVFFDQDRMTRPSPGCESNPSPLGLAPNLPHSHSGSHGGGQPLNHALPRPGPHRRRRSPEAHATNNVLSKSEKNPGCPPAQRESGKIHAWARPKSERSTGKESK